MPTRRCCCGPGEFCNGCCFPLTEGQPVQLAFEISAPNCPELDGATGLFLPEVATNEAGIECGNCLCYTTDPFTPLPTINGSTYEEVGGIDCNPTPCVRSFGLYLMCDRQTVIVDDGNAATDPCCQDIKLLIAFDTGDDLAGDRPRPLNICKDFILSDGHLLADLLELLPSSCECEDETTDFMLVYDLSGLAFLCETEFEGGPCDGFPNCCTPTACSFEDAILTVTR